MDLMTENKVVPKLRFAEFKNEKDTNSYKKHPFTDVFLFSTGKSIKQNEASPQFKTPCVRYGELYHMYGEVIYNVINKTNLPESELLFSKGNEILLPSAGEEPIGIGAASALPFKNIAIGRTINVLSPRIEEMYSQYYVSYYINEKLKKKIARLAKGVSISNVYNSDLKKLKIILPSLKEQLKVDSFLSAVDKKLQQLTKKKELLSAYKKGIMQKIFSQELCFKDDNGNNFPDWEEKKFTELLKLFSSSQVKNSEMLIEGKYPVIEQGKKESLNYSNDENKLIKNECVIVYGDHTTVIKFIDFNFVAGPSVKLLKALNKSDLKYLYYNLCYNNIKPEGYKRHFSILKKIYLQLPNLEEQKKIANFLSAVDNKIDLVSTQIENTKAFKKGLLQQMFV